MTHKFSMQSIGKLDNPERRRWLPPDAVLGKFGLAEGQTMLDIGAGIGYFSLVASRIVGQAGKVIACDVLPEMLTIIKDKANESSATNIETVLLDATNFVLPDRQADLLTAFFLLHELDDPEQILVEAYRVLKTGGKLALIDWEKRQTPQGPPPDRRIAREAALGLMQQVGLAVVVIELHENCYGLLGTKN